jgi:hypothetical protein
MQVKTAAAGRVPAGTRREAIHADPRIDPHLRFAEGLQKEFFRTRRGPPRETPFR